MDHINPPLNLTVTCIRSLTYIHEIYMLKKLLTNIQIAFVDSISNFRFKIHILITYRLRRLDFSVLETLKSSI